MENQTTPHQDDEQNNTALGRWKIGKTWKKNYSCMKTNYLDKRIEKVMQMGDSIP